MPDIVTQLGLGTWNIESGGFAGYDPAIASPEREPLIRAMLQKCVGLGIDSMVIVDAHRWPNYYEGDDGIAKAFNFKHASATYLNDERLNQNHGQELAIAFLTNQPIAETDEIVLGNRSAHRAVLDVGTYGLQVIGIYLDDMSEAVRDQQVGHLLHFIEGSSQGDNAVPTVIAGDLNLINPDFNRRNWPNRLRERAFLQFASRAARKPALRQACNEIRKGRAFKQFTTAGYVPTDHRGNLTYQRGNSAVQIPVLAVDYILTPSAVRTIASSTLPTHASDHRPVVARLAIP